MLHAPSERGDGRVDNARARWRRSPNFGTRYDGKTINAIVLHYTGMNDGDSAERWLCDPASGVSSHYLVYEDGAVVQMVHEIDRAWHAGIGCWQGERDMNSVSVGIEIVNRGHLDWPDDATAGPLEPFPTAQIASVKALCLDVMRRWNIAPDRVVGHSDLAPHRKRDPGEAFPWAELHEAGIGSYVPPEPPMLGASLMQGDGGASVRTLQVMLGKLGFDIDATGNYCEWTTLTVRAFQRHWRPDLIDGRADPSTVRTLERLLAVRHGEKNVARVQRG